MAKPATIKDIAAALHISVSTVSRAMRNARDINAATRQMIMKKARQMKYEPNHSARSLIQKKTHLIGVIVPVLHSNYFSDVLNGMSEALLDSRYQMIVCQSNENNRTERECLKRLLSYNIDGLLISVSKSTKDSRALNEVLKKNIPVVMFDRILENMACSKVLVNEYEGAYKAVEHLIKKGCKRIAHLAGPKDLLITHNRKQGYLDAMRDNGLKVSAGLVEHCRSFEDDAPRAFRKLIGNHPRPDGIFCINDLSAVDCIKYLKRIGIKVPEEIKVAGFNNDPVSLASDPSLTTVMQPCYEVGKLSVGILIDEMEGKAEKGMQYALRTKLVCRGSSR